MINNNLGLILHRYRDTASYWPKIANFAHPLLFSALVRSDFLRIYEKALRFLKLKSFKQPTVKIWWSYLAPFLTDPFVWRTDGRTDGQNWDS